MPEHCPRCKSDDIECADHPTPDGPVHDCRCNHCHYAWKQLVTQ